MPVYKVNIDRQVTNWDRFTRYVEAESEEAAMTIGIRLAAQANDDCPDDAGPGNFDDELGDWRPNDASLADEQDIMIASEAEISELPEEEEQP